MLNRALAATAIFAACPGTVSSVGSPGLGVRVFCASQDGFVDSRPARCRLPRRHGESAQSRSVRETNVRSGSGPIASAVTSGRRRNR